MEAIIIGGIWVAIGLFCLVLSRTRYDRGCSFGIILCGVTLGLIGLVARKEISEAKQMEIPKSIEYRASEYRLQLRIVEFEGQRDTTYVLVKKINEL